MVEEEDKFSEFEEALIVDAVTSHCANWKAQLIKEEDEGKRSIFGVNYPDLMAREIKMKLEFLTRKKVYR